MVDVTVDAIPSYRSRVRTTVVESIDALSSDALAIPVAAGAPVPSELAVDLAALERAGFTAKIGGARSFPRLQGPALVAVGIGDPAELTPAALRDAAAAFAAAVPNDADLATQVPAVAGLAVEDAAAAIVEGVLLTRYRFSLRSTPRPEAAVESLTLVAPAGQSDAVRAGAARGTALARAAMIGRDLAMCPPVVLDSVRMGQVATELAEAAGLQIEIFGVDELRELGCGGLLGVNRGSDRPARMIRLRYTPESPPTGHLTLVGKGIMYDAGGISLKPSDLSHSQMKNDMTGAGVVLAAMTTLGELDCPTTVTGYLMCTDNMPSSRAMQLGDVLTMRNGKTVEVMNTDAEGRLVMADALALGTEEHVDAIVDIATLTGACLRTLGTEVAGVMGNNPSLVQALIAAGARADEPLWELPLIRSYRAQLNSPIADMTNMGGVNAGSITAALFLEEFVNGVPWAHIDIAGTAQSDAATRWINLGPTGFGTRLLVEFAMAFTADCTTD